MRFQFRRLLFAIPLIASIVLLFLIPPEKTLGDLIRLIYFHGAWIWAGIILCVIASVYGLLGILLRKSQFHQWSAAFGVTGLIFLLIYLPMALLVMKLSWNGFFFSEPRWSIPFSLTVADILLQTGVALFKTPILSSLANLSFGTILIYNISKIQSVLHPEAPIQQSGSISGQALFYAVLLCLLVFGILLSRIVLRHQIGGNHVPAR